LGRFNKEDLIMKKYIIFVFLIVFAFGVANAQKIRALPEAGQGYLGTSSRTDSTSWTDSLFFDIPNGMNTDTIFVEVWQYSTEDKPHIGYSVFNAMKIGAPTGTDKEVAKYKLSPDSVALEASDSLEYYHVFEYLGAVKDTLENGHATRKIQPDAVMIHPFARTKNAADSKYWVKVSAMSRFEED